MPEHALPAVIGCDFSSSPSLRKPIVIATGVLSGGACKLSKIERIPTLDEFADWLARDASWVGGFDLPFGLPRELVEHLGWPTDYEACIAHYAQLSREEIRETFQRFCDARPVGGKFAHRATDGPAGSSPSMKWVNPPVSFMLHAGMPRILASGAHVPGLRAGDSARVALEAYPGLLARAIVGTRSYKSDEAAKQTTERFIARKDIIHALEMGEVMLGKQALGLRLKLSHAQRDALLADAKGDSLDAVLCMLQAAWALQQHQAGHACYGLPEFDPLEGWIAGA
ncbi:MAG: hypothetical protein RLZZ271_340 [Pseudomonadota bacterium]